MHQHKTPQPTHILDRLLDPVGRCLSPRAARQLAGLRADEVAQARVHELAEKCNEGTLTAEERAEYESYVMARASWPSSRPKPGPGSIPPPDE
jgi:hypothetical protein